MKTVYYYILVYLSTISIVRSGFKQSLVINIPQGPVRGYRGSEGHYFAFYGIPYAATPKGPDKFKAPLPPQSWYKPLEAVNKNVVCPQYPSPHYILNQQEDCLIANIYIPETQETNLPVLVQIHGGAFQFGYGDIQTLKKLLLKDKLVIVNFNYRVNAHGFLCLGSKDVPGNAGMKDQVAFLRWLQKNIAYFGGNPNDVTLDGWSAGGAAVDFLLVSKMSRGLFHKAIIESGASTGSFSVQIDPILNAKNIAKELGFKDDNNSKSLEMFYKNISFELLTSIDVTNNTNSSLVFAPCIERDVGEEIFLGDYPLNILKNGDVAKLPLLIGISNMEGTFRLYNFEKWRNIMNKKFSHFLPEDLGFRTENEKDMVAMIVKKFYFGKEPVSKDNILGYVDFFTDAMFGYGVAKAAELHAKAANNQVYLYEYAFTDNYQDYIPYTNVRGATHCAQTYALVDEPNEKYFSESYKKIKSLIRETWLNFIYTGKPFPDNSSYPTWPPVSNSKGPYMKLNTTLELKDTLLNHRGLFWDFIYSQYYKAPKPPRPY